MFVATGPGILIQNMVFFMPKPYQLTSTEMSSHGNENWCCCNFFIQKLDEKCIFPQRLLLKFLFLKKSMHMASHLQKERATSHTFYHMIYSSRFIAQAKAEKLPN